MQCRHMVLASCGWLSMALTVFAEDPYPTTIWVNKSIVTDYDINQRMLLLDALGAVGDLREQAIEQLIEDRVKLEAAQAMQIALTEGALAAGLEEFAASRGLTVDHVLWVLDERGIDRGAMDDFVFAGISWREVVSARFMGRATPSEADVHAALVLDAAAPREMVQLAEIALPYGEWGEEETQELAERLYRELTGGASFEAAVREYSRSESASRGGLLDPIVTAELPPAARTQVLLLSPGEVTRPLPITGGLAILKLVAIHLEPPGWDMTDEAARVQRERLFAQRISRLSQDYLQELLGAAEIVGR